MLQAFRLSVSSNLTGESRRSRLSSRRFFGSSHRNLYSAQSNNSHHSAQHEHAHQISSDVQYDDNEGQNKSLRMGTTKHSSLNEKKHRKTSQNSEIGLYENGDQKEISQLIEKKEKRKKEKHRNRHRKHNSVEYRSNGKKVIRRYNSTGDQPSDASRWGISIIKPIYSSSKMRKRKKSSKRKGCSACAFIEARYKSMMELYDLKIHSRDTVIRSFENASSMQQEIINNLREELEKKNSTISSMRNDQVRQKAKEVTMSLDLEIEKKTTHKLCDQMEDLQSQFNRLEVKAEERNRKNDRDVKKLNELVYLQKKQLKAKDEALQQILSSYQERKKTITSLVANIHNVETDLSSHISDNVTQDSRKYITITNNENGRHESFDDLTLEESQF